MTASFSASCASRSGSAEVVHDRREAQVDRLAARVGRQLAKLEVVVHRRDFDLRLRQAHAEHRPDLPVEHRDVELEVVARRAAGCR
jgi:hypothetical protein